MFRIIVVFALLSGTFFCQVKDVSSSETKDSCTWEGLQAKIDVYIESMKKGESSLMPLAADAKYIENRKETLFKEGVWREPLVVDFHRSLLYHITPYLRICNCHDFTIPNCRFPMAGKQWTSL